MIQLTSDNSAVSLPHWLLKVKTIQESNYKRADTHVYLTDFDFFSSGIEVVVRTKVKYWRVSTEHHTHRSNWYCLTNKGKKALALWLLYLITFRHNRHHLENGLRTYFMDKRWCAEGPFHNRDCIMVFLGNRIYYSRRVTAIKHGSNVLLFKVMISVLFSQVFLMIQNPQSHHQTMICYNCKFNTVTSVPSHQGYVYENPSKYFQFMG